MDIKNVIAGPQELQALQISIGQGLDWWMTRLYFLSSLAADLTLVEVLVFVGEAEMFIRIINPKIVKERLAQANPMIKQYEDVLTQSGPPHADLLNEVDRRANLWTMQMQLTGGENSNPIFVTKRELDHWITP